MKRPKLVFLIASLLVVSLFFSACGSNKSGCPINENTHVKTDKKGNMSSNRGKSNLFPKNMRSGSKKKKN
jgi:thioredoxin-related protein